MQVGTHATSGRYVYDGMGNIVEIGTQAEPGIDENGEFHENHYVYDGLSRLIQTTLSSSTAGDATVNHRYDAFGNMINHWIIGPGEVGADHIPITPIDSLTNQLAEHPNYPSEPYDPNDLGWDYWQTHYNENGSLAKHGGSGYYWGPFGEMIYQWGTDFSLAPGQWAYLYTASDERLAVCENWSHCTWTLRAPDGKALSRYESPPIPWGGWLWMLWQEDYVYREGQLLGTQREAAEGGRLHYHLDHLGTPRMVTNAYGDAVVRTDLYPFGMEMTATNQMAKRGSGLEQVMKFTGHERDYVGGTAENNAQYLDYLHARYYNPNLGRFLTVDPINSARAKMPQTWNKYAYGRNNPLRFIDPNGQADKDSVYVVRVNVVYSNADVKIRGSQTLRQVTERGIQKAKRFFNNAGVALDVRRYEGSIAVSGRKADGMVKTGRGEVSLGNFTSSQQGITVLASADLNITGKTVGVGGPTGVGSQSNEATMTDELAHGLGNVTPVNVPLVSNLLTDLWTDANELYVATDSGLAPAYEEMIREGAEEVGCNAADPGCGGAQPK